MPISSFLKTISLSLLTIPLLDAADNIEDKEPIRSSPQVTIPENEQELLTSMMVEELSYNGKLTEQMVTALWDYVDKEFPSSSN